MHKSGAFAHRIAEISAISIAAGTSSAWATRWTRQDGVLGQSEQALRALPVALRPLEILFLETGNLAKACERFHEAEAVWARLEQENRISDFDRQNDLTANRALLEQCR